MGKAGPGLQRAAAPLAALALWAPLARTADFIPAGAYDLTIETTMPNLDQALRYATVRETRCLHSRDLAAAFPLLRHDALRGCGLAPEKSDGETAYYLLVCDGGNMATGGAVWRLDGTQVQGALEVKFGGKNMTVSQRVTARLLGACPAGGD